jgi:hypothetical protein
MRTKHTYTSNNRDCVAFFFLPLLGDDTATGHSKDASGGHNAGGGRAVDGLKQSLADMVSAVPLSQYHVNISSISFQCHLNFISTFCLRSARVHLFVVLIDFVLISQCTNGMRVLVAGYAELPSSWWEGEREQEYLRVINLPSSSASEGHSDGTCDAANCEKCAEHNLYATYENDAVMQYLGILGT